MKKYSYIIRKVVNATSMADALKREPQGTILDVIVCADLPKNKQLFPHIGFEPSQRKPYEE